MLDEREENRLDREAAERRQELRDAYCEPRRRPRADEDAELCGACDGSGEGYAPDSQCSACRGAGRVRLEQQL